MQHVSPILISSRLTHCTTLTTPIPFPNLSFSQGIIGLSYLSAPRLRVNDVARVNSLTVILDQLLVAILAASDAADIFAVADDGDGNVTGGLVDVGVLWRGWVLVALCMRGRRREQEVEEWGEERVVGVGER